MTHFTIKDLPQEYQFLKDSSILIIGNGPSAAKHEMGREIDKFDQIIRINNYVTDHMESRVGSRTDIWVNGANQGLKKRLTLPEKILVMIPPVVLNHKGVAIHRRIENRLGSKNYTLLPLEIMSEMESSCGLDRPTTGFFTIYFFYLLGLDVTLHGFDFFVGSTAHYFDSPLKRWLKEKGIIKKAVKHDVVGEKVFIETLIQKGGVKVLHA
ncbi:MAG: glycosyltransferase family 29 protein [Candidatus Marinimicrobia bacterium]|nr:glycosyltransferase family 29 protein [Candidatus Neomarinimicrobiota bacterium]